MKKNKKKDYAYYVRKYLLSTFVVASFAAYVIHDRNADPGATGAVIPTQTLTTGTQQAPVTTFFPTISPQSASVGSSSTAKSQSLIGPPAPAKVATTAAPVQVTPTSVPPTEPAPTPAPAATTAKGVYKDGQFTGAAADAYYGPVQVKVVIQNGRITDVQFVDYPHDRRRSTQINNQVMPWLHDEALQAQSAQVDIISGATLTSEAFVESLQSALDSAKS